jgi:hypothetical protein
MQNNEVHVLFLHPQNDDPFLNRITSMMGQAIHGKGACHVELAMPHSGGYMTSSIYNGETVNVTTSKTFSNPGYNVQTLLVSDTQLSTMKSKVLSCHGRKDSFDPVGMYLACLPLQIPHWKPRNSTFCSKYITEVLQTANIQEVQGLNANITTPSRLLKILQPATRNTIGSVTHKLKTMETRGVFTYVPINSL